MKATASDFEKEAQKAANAFWIWLITTAIMVYFFGWWWLLMGLFCVYCIFESLMDTRAAMRLKKASMKFLTATMVHRMAMQLVCPMKNWNLIR